MPAVPYAMPGAWGRRLFDARAFVTASASDRDNMAPIAPYSKATAKIDRSMPRRGRNRNPATRDPAAAPVVLASVRTPAVVASDSRQLRSAAPIRVKRTPDSRETGNISGAAIRRIATGFAIVVSRIGSMSRGNNPYETTHRRPAPNATVEA